jgi:hypothetical protein
MANRHSALAQARSPPSPVAPLPYPGPTEQNLRGSAHVSVMQAPHHRKLDDFAHLRRLHRTLPRRVLAERQMGAAGVIILTNESPKQPSQVPLVHDNHMIEELSPQCADKAFRIWILPRGPSGNDHFLDAQRQLILIRRSASKREVVCFRGVAEGRF